MGGLVRFCVNKYSMDPAEISDKQMHVCNYDVNKQSEKFKDNEDPLQPKGHKWTLSGLCHWMKSEGERTEALSIEQMWAEIEDLVVKSILCGFTSLKEEMNTGQKKEVKSLSNLDRKNAACAKLNIPNMSSQYQIGYSPELYSTALDGQSLRKQKKFKRTDFNRAAYLEEILEELT